MKILTKKNGSKFVLLTHIRTGIKDEHQLMFVSELIKSGKWKI